MPHEGMSWTPPGPMAPAARPAPPLLAYPELLVGQAALIQSMAEAGVAVSAEYGSAAGGGFTLFIWIPPPLARRYLDAGEFWTEWVMGERVWMRFTHRVNLLGRAVFEAVETRPAHGPEPLPPGALWFLSKPLGLQSGAKP